MEGDGGEGAAGRPSLNFRFGRSDGRVVFFARSEILADGRRLFFAQGLGVAMTESYFLHSLKFMSSLKPV